MRRGEEELRDVWVSEGLMAPALPMHAAAFLPSQQRKGRMLRSMKLLKSWWLPVLFPWTHLPALAPLAGGSKDKAHHCQYRQTPTSLGGSWLLTPVPHLSL